MDLDPTFYVDAIQIQNLISYRQVARQKIVINFKIFNNFFQKGFENGSNLDPGPQHWFKKKKGGL